ncbi:MAG: 50S ribosomal protein L21 [Candidatus Niyogibacteria bacterium CG10_big_fil_rev_8_21_14_0_10_46_36]|uniref:Large ribosomal subunit protein bL21 n=1 Tax=Candidatus Niyogibacteria bacterium CG10_big_fil_rev_8_21_14_0_10_46_36 TaxID=1974726 RepID=A0A2H0TE40_9BACT|nr:MAG: 50S ribosomal protein L21 [Candidatus Niyogibacteria bacterium CG10_big_fil_rev_8_21_14_0_10_46_36]
MPFAVFATGGKQYIAEKGKKIKVEKLNAPGKKGGVEFDKVLLVEDGKHVTIGTPFVSGAKITAEIASEGRHKKIDVIRYKSKTRYHKKKGHKQQYTEVLIKDIKAK